MSSIIIKKFLREELSKNTLWYHGTPDVRDLEKVGGFTERTISMTYIKDLEGYYFLQEKLKTTRDIDEEQYHKYLSMVPDTKDVFKMRKPIFLTNNYGVAKTYADSRRSMDYQNAIEKVLKVIVNTNNGVKIKAFGDRFRFLNIDKVTQGFIEAGVKEEDFNTTLRRFNFYVKNNEGIMTDMIAAIGEWFGFDYIDVVGVLDSYNGGSVKSTVRMVFNPSDIKIIK